MRFANRTTTIVLSPFALVVGSAAVAQDGQPLPVVDFPVEAASSPQAADRKDARPLLAPNAVMISGLTVAALPSAIESPLDLPTGEVPQEIDPLPGDQSDIVVKARPRSAPGDPLQAVNVQTYAATQAVDKAVVAPVALTYQKVLPDPLRAGIRNFFNNLSEPVSFLNFMLQIKPGRAAETVARFAVNTTVGVGGVIDVARRKPFRLPRRPNGFANTLGFYGVKPGPFLFLPLIGPTTVRDLVGLSIDRMVLPSTIGAPFNQPTYTAPATIVGSLDYRAEFDTQLQAFKDSPDPYAASRAHYLAGRQAEIDALRGRVPSQPIDRRTLPVLP
ncbi:MlaA family lipoprotein [Sphingobium amiense]|uniref:MlaA family lipoprotein n=1 Tax=Sphingobium amiense TaxID=135719 RepID=UPI000A055898|nr:VacJ family lipoprotein [Sphingobium amiense]